MREFYNYPDELLCTKEEWCILELEEDQIVSDAYNSVQIVETGLYNIARGILFKNKASGHYSFEAILASVEGPLDRQMNRQLNREEFES